MGGITIETKNREVKSDVFSLLMEEKENALQVYNALNGSDYKDPEMVEIVKLETGISLTIRNDASFILDMYLSIYEHQSSFNPNMPLRMLIYVAEIFKGYVKAMEYDLFGHRRIELPTPKFVVFYNGTENRPAQEVMRLSDLFHHKEEKPELELMCAVYNINPGNNSDFMGKCSILNQYTAFIEKVRDNQTNNVESPIKQAIDYCIEHDILRDFLSRKGDAVLRIMTIDMTWEAREKLIRRDEREEGRAEGREEGREEERLNTEREKERADAAEDKVNELSNRIKELEKQLAAQSK